MGRFRRNSGRPSCKPPGCSGVSAASLLKARSTGDHGKPGRMVMIAANRNCSVALYPLDGLCGLPIVHHIANAPSWSKSRSAVLAAPPSGMNIGDDDDSQTPSYGTLAATSGVCEFRFAEAFERAETPDEPRQESHPPSISIRMEQRFRQPFALCTCLVDA